MGEKLSLLTSKISSRYETSFGATDKILKRKPLDRYRHELGKNRIKEQSLKCPVTSRILIAHSTRYKTVKKCEKSCIYQCKD